MLLRQDPAFIMVASCRVNMAISEGVIFLPPPPSKGLDFFLTDFGLMPSCRNCALAMATLADSISPFDGRPFWSTPCQINLCPFAVVVAMV